MYNDIKHIKFWIITTAGSLEHSKYAKQTYKERPFTTKTAEPLHTLLGKKEASCFISSSDANKY